MSNPGSSSPTSSSSTTREITKEELAKHNTRQDAWIALKGKVFDVTSYVDKHPGGFSAIKQGFGIDATALFTKAHSYVSFEKILAGKQVGVLKNTNNPSLKP